MDTLFGIILLISVVTSVLFFIVFPIMRKPVDPFLHENTPDDEKKKRIEEHRDKKNDVSDDDRESPWKF